MFAGELRVPINSDQDIVLARQKGRALAGEAGFSAVDCTLVATAISELARNIGDGFSTSGSLGLGLPGVKRLVAEFQISSSAGQGTVVKVTKWRLDHRER